MLGPAGRGGGGQSGGRQGHGPPPSHHAPGPSLLAKCFISKKNQVKPIYFPLSPPSSPLSRVHSALSPPPTSLLSSPTDPFAPHSPLLFPQLAEPLGSVGASPPSPGVAALLSPPAPLFAPPRKGQQPLAAPSQATLEECSSWRRRCSGSAGESLRCVPRCPSQGNWGGRKAGGPGGPLARQAGGGGVATPTSPMGAGCASLAGMSPCACKQGDAWAMGGGSHPGLWGG